MKSRKPQHAIWIAALFFAGAIQYFIPAVLATQAGAISYWKIPEEYMLQAGPERYLRDALSIAFSFYWPIICKKNTEFKVYFFWIIFLFIFGISAYFIGNGYRPFIVSGFRWLVILHISFGSYFLINQYGINARQNRMIFGVVLSLGMLSSLFSLLQFRLHGSLSLLGQTRVPGIFSLGAVNGYYAASLSIIALASRHLVIRKWTAYLCSLSIGMLSGTRFTIICILLIIFIENIDKLNRVKGLRLLAYVTLLPSMLAFTIFAAGTLSGRGDLVTDQMQNGGRLGNGLQVIRFLAATGSPIDYLIGRGIGQGTNGAMALLGTNSYIPQWQILVDNTFITSFIQFGLIGLFWMVLGVSIFFIQKRNAVSLPFFAIILISMLTQNIFEQFFWMISIAYYFGVKSHIYGKARVRTYRQVTQLAHQKGRDTAQLDASKNL